MLFAACTQYVFLMPDYEQFGQTGGPHIHLEEIGRYSEINSQQSILPSQNTFQNRNIESLNIFLCKHLHICCLSFCSKNQPHSPFPLTQVQCLRLPPSGICFLLCLVTASARNPSENMTDRGRDDIKLILCKTRPTMIISKLTQQSPKTGREQKQSCRYFTEGCKWEVMKLAMASLWWCFQGLQPSWNCLEGSRHVNAGLEGRRVRLRALDKFSLFTMSLENQSAAFSCSSDDPEVQSSCHPRSIKSCSGRFGVIRQKGAFYSTVTNSRMCYVTACCTISWLGKHSLNK